MNLKDWLKEYYPQKVTKKLVKSMTWKQAVEHSLRKWRGLRKEVLKKYGLEKDRTEISDGKSYIVINYKTCALCKKSSDPRNDGVINCDLCPLPRVLGYNPCTDPGPYTKFGWDGDANPMIRALEKTLKALTEEEDRA